MQRLAGPVLRLAARLTETPGPRSGIYRLVVRQFGFDRLRDVAIPEHAVPYTPTHLHPDPGEPRPGADRER